MRLPPCAIRLTEIVSAVCVCGSSGVGQTPTVTIGQLQSPTEQIFGAIQSVVADSSGIIYILDRQSLEIRMFSKTGAYVGGGAGRGSGPGELRVPVGMVINDTGRLYIVDNYFNRAAVFERQASRLVPVGNIKLPNNPYALCAIASRLFVVAPSEKAIIHEIRSNGDVVKSFGPPKRIVDDPRLNWPGVKASMLDEQNAGHLLCLTPELIVFAHRSLPDVVAYRSDGRVVWHTTVRDFKRARWVTGSSPGTLTQAADPKTKTVHQSRALFKVDESTIAVVISEHKLAGQVGDYDVRFLSLATGKEVRRGRSPALITNSTKFGFLGYVNVPFPRVIVYPSIPFRKE